MKLLITYFGKESSKCNMTFSKLPSPLWTPIWKTGEIFALLPPLYLKKCDKIPRPKYKTGHILGHRMVNVISE